MQNDTSFLDYRVKPLITSNANSILQYETPADVQQVLSFPLQDGGKKIEITAIKTVHCIYFH